VEGIGTFLYNNLEWVIGSIGIVGTGIVLMTRKTYDHSNDLTPYVVKLNKQKDAISKQSK
jgi:hypothetical protein